MTKKRIIYCYKIINECVIDYSNIIFVLDNLLKGKIKNGVIIGFTELKYDKGYVKQYSEQRLFVFADTPVSAVIIPKRAFTRPITLRYLGEKECLICSAKGRTLGYYPMVSYGNSLLDIKEIDDFMTEMARL